jgi:hypothetical protein
MLGHYWRIYFSSICDKLICANTASGINQFCQFFRTNFAALDASIASTLSASKEETVAERVRRSDIKTNTRALEKLPKTSLQLDGHSSKQ